MPTQLHRAVGSSEAEGSPVSGAPAAISADGDPPTLKLPPVPAGHGPHPGRSRDLEPVRREHRSRRRRARRHRGLKRAIWATTVALILAIGALVATDVHPWHLFNNTATNAASGKQHRSQAKATSALKPVSVGGYIATYNVTSQSFSVTVSTDRPTWVEARAGASGPTTFAAELPAGATKQLQSNGPLWIEVGAGGTTLVVHAGGKVIGTLHPTLAPWQATFTPTPAGTPATAGG
ncbi:MAG: hypothetical protein J2O39_05850 [Acidimicrobiales bacterium]|nr:hypothetical protein [Acidimicrobiales bacterium]MBO0886054.1 hypothetical protein [Acidimicrobiales bacterium]MBO0893879.1 hypothetical protein [Acidimicrobiales bacterium]